MNAREKLIITALIHTAEQEIFTVDEVVLIAENFHNRYMLTEEALEELYDALEIKKTLSH